MIVYTLILINLFAAEMDTLPPPPSEFRFEVPDGYVYDPKDRRDPFKPYGGGELNLTDTNKKPVFVEDPLQLFEIDRLSVIAIMWSVNKPRALVKDPSGKIHTVRQGTKLGLSNGEILAIREGEIVVMESKLVGGSLERSPKILTLSK